MNSRTGDQLELALDDVRLQLVVEPWGGLSPRALTRGYERFNLKAQAAKSVSEFVSCDQLEFWPAQIEGPPVYLGAPLLIEPGGCRG